MLITSLTCSAEPQADLIAQEIFSRYQQLRENTLQRLINLENRIDGLTPEFRELLGDRKKVYPTDFKGTGKPLLNPLLHYSIITERKRLENESSFMNELSQSPLLIKQYSKKLASNLLVLETTNILATFVEYLDQYNRGERGFPSSPRALASTGTPITPGDGEIIKVLAGTLTAIDYSKEKKASLALTQERITSLNPEESKATLKLIESGLGPWNQDSLPPVEKTLSKAEQQLQETRRLERTKDLVKMVEGLASAFSVANKALGDEYQYRVLKLNQKVKSQLNQKSGP